MKRLTPPLVIAHRGASADHAENSLAAFEAAIAQGADMIEFDIRQSADGELIVIHDDRVEGQLVSDLTRAEIGKLTGQLPAVLDDVLELAKHRIGLDIELKTSGFVASVVDSLKGYPAEAGLFISSFRDEVIKEVRALNPELQTALLVGQRHKQQRLSRFKADLFPLRRLETLKPTYFAPHSSLVQAGLAHHMNSKGNYQSMVWTVNDPKRLRALMQNTAVAGIITDVPDVAVKIRDELFGLNLG